MFLYQKNDYLRSVTASVTEGGTEFCLMKWVSTISLAIWLVNILSILIFYVMCKSIYLKKKTSVTPCRQGAKPCVFCSILAVSPTSLWIFFVFLLNSTSIHSLILVFIGFCQTAFFHTPIPDLNGSISIMSAFSFEIL